MIVAIVVEVIVLSLEHAPVVRILLRLVGVLSEENSVLEFDEEVVRCSRLSPDVVEHGTHVYIHIGHLRQHFPKAAEVVGVPAHVRSDEGRLRISPEQVVALLHQLVEIRMLTWRHATSREE